MGNHQFETTEQGIRRTKRAKKGKIEESISGHCFRITGKNENLVAIGMELLYVGWVSPVNKKGNCQMNMESFI